MKVIVAPDSFGGWRTARQIAAAIADPLAQEGHEVVVLPMSDGGEGLLVALQDAGKLTRIQHVIAEGPDGTRRTGPVGWHHEHLYVESSTWLKQSPPHAPWQWTSRGLGRVLHPHVGRPVVIGLGGTSTVDAGLGLLSALGGQLLDSAGHPIAPRPDHFFQLARLELCPHLAKSWTCWTDVCTPLTDGAHRFGPQKGVALDQLGPLAKGWSHVADVLDRWRTRHHLPILSRTLPGGGAAGGVGWVLANLGARLESGAAAVIRATGLMAHLRDADVLISGEGRLDATTLEAKVVSELAARCGAVGTRLMLLVGARDDAVPRNLGTVFVCDNSESRDQAFEAGLQQLVGAVRSLTCPEGQFPQAALPESPAQ